jgi:hypothetical protein
MTYADEIGFIVVVCAFIDVMNVKNRSSFWLIANGAFAARCRPARQSIMAISVTDIALLSLRALLVTARSEQLKPLLGFPLTIGSLDAMMLAVQPRNWAALLVTTLTKPAPYTVGAGFFNAGSIIREALFAHCAAGLRFCSATRAVALRQSKDLINRIFVNTQLASDLSPVVSGSVDGEHFTSIYFRRHNVLRFARTPASPIGYNLSTPKRHRLTVASRQIS